MHPYRVLNNDVPRAGVQVRCQERESLIETGKQPQGRIVILVQQRDAGIQGQFQAVNKIILGHALDYSRRNNATA